MLNPPVNYQTIPLSQNTVVKVDICFYQIVAELQKNYAEMRSFFFYRITFSIFLAIIHFTINYQDTDTTIRNLFCVLFLSDIFRPIHYHWILNKHLKSCTKVQEIAQTLEHAQKIKPDLLSLLIDPFEELYIGDENRNLKVSKRIYSYKNNLSERAMTPLARGILIGSSKVLFQKQIKGFKTEVTHCIVSLLTFFYIIDVLFRQETLEQKICAFLIVYLASELYAKPNLYIGMFLLTILIILLPLICLCCCGLGIYTCYLNPIKKANLPQSVEATNQIISKTQGMCTICYLNLVEKEKIVVLKCSEKHAFHQNCIKSWSDKKANCPICRTQI